MMQFLTALVLGAFAGYAGAWYFGLVEGNFALLLFCACVVTGVYWLAERVYFLPQRRAAAAGTGGAGRAPSRRTGGARHHPGGWRCCRGAPENPDAALVAGLDRWPVPGDPGRVFPAFLPGGAFSHSVGIHDAHAACRRPDSGEQIHLRRAPAGDQQKVTQGNAPQRGDVMVFRYPPKPGLDYIKRVVGVPGDEVAYLNKQLTINGKPVSARRCPISLTRTPCAIPSSSRRVARAAPPPLLDDDRPAFIPGCRRLPVSATIAATVSKVWSARCPRATIS